MKKFLLALAAFAAASVTSYAQLSSTDSTTLSTLKPEAKKWATELNINPFNGTISLNNSINQIKFRYFSTPDVAFRIGFIGSREAKSEKNSNPYGSNPYNFRNERSTTTVGVNLGLEKHFRGTKRLSPYIGADLALAYKASNQEITEGQSVTNVKGAWINYAYYNNNPSYRVESFEQHGFFRFGLNLVTGFDFYMAKNFFFGYEMNFGFMQTNQQDVEVKRGSVASPSTPGDISNNTFTFGPSLMNGIRVGYVF